METLGKYIILGELGEGGMGMVYRARDPQIGREVAIKVIHQRALHVPEARDRFYREARSAGKLSHENIMTIYDVGEEDGDPFIVMELLGGSDLRSLLQSQHVLSLDQKLAIALQICRGLHYAHRHHVVHRDVKPENIRVLEGNRVKIMDFGIARLGGESQTLTHTSIGSPRYMSPEQVRGHHIDHRADIFSFGVLLYELLTGINPFSGEHVTTVIYKIIHEQPDPITLDDPNLTDGLRPIVSRCLEKEADARYQDFGAVIADLETVLAAWKSGQTATLAAGLPTHATALEHRTEPAAGAAAMPWRGIAIAVVVMVALAVGGFLLMDRAPVVDSTPTDASTVTPPAPQPTSPTPAEDLSLAADDAAAEDEADGVGDGPPGAELEGLRSAMVQRQSEAQLERQRADAAQAETLAPAAYARAQRLEQAGEAAAREATPTSYETARQAFRDAAAAYASALREAQQRQRADAARSAMNRIRDALGDGASGTGLTAAYEEAETTRTTAAQAYRSGRYAESARGFDQARQQYDALRAQLAARDADVPPAPDPAEATARQAAQGTETARLSVRDELKSTAVYDRARQTEQRAHDALASADFTTAAALYDEAEGLYREAARAPSPAEQVSRSLGTLLSQFERSFEQEDASGLSGLHPFYASFSSFFDIARNVQVDVSDEAPRVEGSSAVVRIRVRIAYEDNKGRDQTTSFVHAWTLEPTADGLWRLAHVTPE